MVNSSHMTQCLIKRNKIFWYPPWGWGNDGKLPNSFLATYKQRIMFPRVGANGRRRWQWITGLYSLSFKSFMDSLLLDVTPKPKAHLSNWQVAVDGEPRTILVFKNYKKKKEKDFLLLLSFLFKKKNSRNSSRRFLFEKRCGHRQNGDSEKKKPFFLFFISIRILKGSVSQLQPVCIKIVIEGNRFMGLDHSS